jgi:hypothetical protein
MVMQNRHDGTNPHGWWDDLPPALRKRFASAPRPESSQPDLPEAVPPEGDGSAVARPGVIADLSRVAVLFLAVAIANLLFLLLALSFLFGGRPAT